MSILTYHVIEMIFFFQKAYLFVGVTMEERFIIICLNQLNENLHVVCVDPFHEFFKIIVSLFGFLFL